MFCSWPQTYTARYARWMGNGSEWWATISGPSRAQEEYVRATAWRDIWDTSKEGNERGPLQLKAQQKVDGIHQQRMAKSFEQKKEVVKLLEWETKVRLVFSWSVWRCSFQVGRIREARWSTWVFARPSLYLKTCFFSNESNCLGYSVYQSLYRSNYYVFLLGRKKGTYG